MKTKFVLSGLIVIGSALFMPATSAQGQIFRRDYNNDNTRQDQREQQAREARARVNEAEAKVKDAVTRVRASWKANPEMLSAEKELNDARQARDEQRKHVVASLKEDDKYMQLEKEHSQAAIDVKQSPSNTTQPTTQESAAPPSQERMDAATEKLEAKSDLRDYVDAAVAKDDGAQAAQKRFDAAQAKLKEMKLQLDAALQNDPDFKAAQQQLAAAHGEAASPTR